MRGRPHATTLPIVTSSYFPDDPPTRHSRFKAKLQHDITSGRKAMGQCIPKSGSAGGHVQRPMWTESRLKRARPHALSPCPPIQGLGTTPPGGPSGTPLGSAGGSSGMSRTQPPPPPPPPASPPDKLCCDKCDGKHLTEKCPYYPKPRENHPDAQRRRPPDMGRPCGNVVITNARVVRQPGDGSCLFHALSYGMNGPGATTLRRELADWVCSHPDTEI
eukprot:Sspe_Gene.94675::Locus_67023_Transcript_1_1_Confidence_1.000_Length_729::g.94675::m.94675